METKKQTPNADTSDAAQYLARGWSIVPVGADKRPLVKWADFQKRRPTEDEVGAWARQFPGCGWALVTGQVSGGLIGLDLDPGHSDATAGREFPPTPMCETPRGGQHLLFRSDGLPMRSGEVLRHVEVKAEGATLIVPPTAGYCWIVPPDEPLAPLPPWLTEAHAAWLETKQTTRTEAVEGEPILEGQRNAALARMAGAMRRQGMTADEIEAALLAVNAGRCQPPLPDSRVQATAASVGRYPPAATDDAEGEPRPPALTVVSAGALFAAGEPEPVPHWIEATVPEGGQVFLVSSPGLGKTWYASLVAVSLASGQDFLGRFAVERAAPVLFLDLENPPGELRRRLWCLARAGEVPPEEWADKQVPLHIGTGYVSLTTEREADALSAIVRDLRPALVIVDSWARLLGTLSENDASDMSRATGFLTRLSRATGCAWLILTHPPKMRGDRDVPEASLRGSGDLAARADLAFELRPLEGDGQTFLVTQTKNRLGPRQSPFTVTVTDTEEGGVELVAGAAPDEWTEKIARAEQIILAHLGAEGETSREDLSRIVKDAGLPARAASSALTNLRKREPAPVTSRREGHRAVYSLAPHQPKQAAFEESG